MRSFGLIALVILLAATACIPTEQSPVPTASVPPVQAAPDPGLVEFETRVAAGLTREGELVRGLAAASTGSQAQLGLAARQMAGWAAEELAWLDEHPADPCYADAAAAYEAGLSGVAAAAAALGELAAASTAPSDEAGQAAGQSLADGTSSLQQAAALAKSARAACR